MKIEDVAEVAHEVNRAFCKSIGDDSQPSWENAPQWQKDSAISGVQIHFDNPGLTPEESHESWLSFKKKDGWIYGPVKDADKKEHPCMVPYQDLPIEQRSKDYIFSAVVASLKDHVIPWEGEND